MNKQTMILGVVLFGAGLWAGSFMNGDDAEPVAGLSDAPTAPIATAAVSAPPPMGSDENAGLSGRFPSDPVLLDVENIRARVQALDLTESENVWARIPWVPSLEEAQQLSQSSGRPIFFFSMYGELDGRC